MGIVLSKSRKIVTLSSQLLVRGASKKWTENPGHRLTMTVSSGGNVVGCIYWCEKDSYVFAENVGTELPLACDDWWRWLTRRRAYAWVSNICAYSPCNPLPPLPPLPLLGILQWFALSNSHSYSCFLLCAYLRSLSLCISIIELSLHPNEYTNYICEQRECDGNNPMILKNLTDIRDVSFQENTIEENKFVHIK